MIFSNKILVVTNLKIRNESINYVNEIKFLGIILDDKLKFSNHISNVCNKISKNLRNIYQTVTSIALRRSQDDVFQSSVPSPNIPSGGVG